MKKKEYSKPESLVYDIKPSQMLCASPDSYGSDDPEHPYDLG